MAENWTADAVLELARSFQPACTIAAAADWNVFTVLARTPAPASALASEVNADVRAMAILLDALVALKLLVKHDQEYRVPPDVASLLSEDGPETVLPMILHQANCLRRWAQLSRVVQTGKPAERAASIRGADADQASFIGAMDNVSGPIADSLVSEIHPGRFSHLLDIGGASGTWTVAFLRATPEATATVFDLPEVIPMAHTRIRNAGLSDRVRLVPGDFYTDDLPGGADLMWLSAIAHQNSRRQNRVLFEKCHRACIEGGLLLIRDVVMDESRTQPPAGAMFAINMLVATEGGGTYTFSEYREDLRQAGFTEVRLVRQDAWMSSVIQAKKRGN